MTCALVVWFGQFSSIYAFLLLFRVWFCLCLALFKVRCFLASKSFTWGLFKKFCFGDFFNLIQLFDVSKDHKQSFECQEEDKFWYSF